MSDDKVKIQPLGSRVLVRLDKDPESRTSSGFYLPENAKEKPQTGFVVAVGDDDENIKVNPGQRILFPRYSGIEFKLDGLDHIILDADDVLAIINI
jgi:chaperonin GroES